MFIYLLLHYITLPCCLDSTSDTSLMIKAHGLVSELSQTFAQAVVSTPNMHAKLKPNCSHSSWMKVSHRWVKPSKSKTKCQSKRVSKYYRFGPALHSHNVYYVQVTLFSPAELVHTEAPIIGVLLSASHLLLGFNTVNTFQTKW